MDVDAAVEFAGADPLGTGIGSRIGPVMRRASKSAAENRDAEAEDRAAAGLRTGESGANASLSGTSTKTASRAWGSAPCALSTGWPSRLWTIAAGSAACAGAAARRGDLRQGRQIGVAQHQADVGVRDQPALPVDHIGIAALADLHRGDDVPDQLEVDLGDRDAGIAAVWAIAIVMYGSDSLRK